jgi:hypothetical protein
MGHELASAGHEEAHQGTDQPAAERARRDLLPQFAGGEAPEQSNLDHVAISPRGMLPGR